MDKYWFNGGGMVDIQGISIIPHTSAKIQALCFYKGGEIQMKFVEITGDEYTNWGNDDDYLISLVGHKLGMGERLQPVSSVPDIEPAKPFTPYKFSSGIPVAMAVANDDNRSVHNETDIQRITSLETELEEQRKKLAQIIGLLGKTTI